MKAEFNNRASRRRSPTACYALDLGFSASRLSRSWMDSSMVRQNPRTYHGLMVFEKNTLALCSSILPIVSVWNCF